MFCTNTSHRSMILSAMARSDSCLRSSSILRLLWLAEICSTEVPLILGGTALERLSPPGRSTRITSAPSAPSSFVDHGLIAATVRSKTRMTSRILANANPLRRRSCFCGFEPGQRQLLGDIVIDDLDRHPGADIAVGDGDQVGHQPWFLRQFDFRHVVGNLAFEAFEVGLVEDHPGAYAAVPAKRRPVKFARPASRAERGGWIPHLGALLALLHPQLMPLERVPIRLVE